MFTINHNAILEYNRIDLENSNSLKEKSELKEKISKKYPYYGYVNIKVCDLEFKMFSNNDDFVAKTYYWNGANSYEGYSTKIWYYLSKKSMTTLDIGSYTGLFSLIAAKSNPKTKVFAFEALDRVHSRLVINKAVNQIGNLQCLLHAVSDKEDEIEFNIFMGDEILTSGSSLEIIKNFKVNHVKKIKSIDIDSFKLSNNIKRIDLVKIDVETAEAKILKGMEKTLSLDKPDLLMEIFDSVNINYINEILVANNYFIYLINDKKEILTKLNSIYEVKKIANKDELNCLISTKKLNHILEIIK